MNKRNFYAVVFLLSFVCLIGTIATNVQQYAQYNKEKERIEKQEERRERYEDMKMMHEVGLLENEPDKPSISSVNEHIKTPYNCLNVTVSIFFWMMAAVSTVTCLLAWSYQFDCSKQEKIRLQVISSLALVSTIIGVLYWALNYHW